MKTFFKKSDRVYILHLETGEDLLEGINRAIKENGIQDAVVMAGLGTLDACSMHIVTSLGFPVKNELITWEKTPIGVSAINGTIIGGVPHVHMVISLYAKEGGTFSGHLEAGSRVMCRMEVILCELTGKALERVADADGIDTIAFA